MFTVDPLKRDKKQRNQVLNMREKKHLYEPVSVEINDQDFNMKAHSTHFIISELSVYFAKKIEIDNRYTHNRSVCLSRCQP